MHGERRAVGLGSRHVPRHPLLQAGAPQTAPQPVHGSPRCSPQPPQQPAHGSLSRAAHLCAGQASDEIYISHTCMHCISIPQASEDRELATFLGSVELLSSLTQAQLGRLSGVVTTLKFNGGEYVVRQGEVADSVF